MIRETDLGGATREAGGRGWRLMGEGGRESGMQLFQLAFSLYVCTCRRAPVFSMTGR